MLACLVLGLILVFNFCFELIACFVFLNVGVFYLGLILIYYRF